MKIARRAETLGLHVRDYMRRMALHGGNIADPRDSQAQLAALAKIAFEANRIGVNINQVVRAGHALGMAPDLTGLGHDLADLIERARRAIAEVAR